MGFGKNVGKYQLHKTIGEGTFAKVKLAINTVNGEKVAIKIIDKHMVIKNNLINQEKREIRTMKLLHHPNIVRIHEVIGTKTKIYIVMEYVPGGQLSDKMSYIGRLSESEARKSFQQLIDAVDYCHCRGVYHRDLKPQNLLLDIKGNLKVSDFGLSTLRKPGTLLSTACGSPSYVAPELLTSRAYDGAPADVWSCGVILYELLSGDLPFDDHNLINLYRKISRADYIIPLWFMEGEKSLIRRIFDTNPRTRITVAEIIEDQWFQINYEPAVGIKSDYVITLNDVHAAFGSIKESEIDTNMPRSPSFINAFQLIAMSQDLDLSGLFEEQDNEKKRIKIGSMHSIDVTIGKIEAAANDMSLLVERRNNSKMKMHPKQKMSRCCRSCFDLSAEVIEVAPTHCVVEISKSTGELALYKEFCRSLSSMLTEESRLLSEIQECGDFSIYSKKIEESKSCEKKDTDNKDLLGLDILPLDA